MEGCLREPEIDLTSSDHNETHKTFSQISDEDDERAESSSQVQILFEEASMS